MGKFSEAREKFEKQLTEPPYVKALIGLSDDGSLSEERAKARFVARADEWSGGATESNVCCKIYESTDDGDRGGVVLSLTSVVHASGFISYAESTDKGVDLHLCGDEEAEAHVRVLVRAMLRSPKLRRIVLREAAVATIDDAEETYYRDGRDYSALDPYE